MTTINLKNYYPWYKHDEYIDVPDEVAAELEADKQYEASYQRQLFRNKAHYSLDCEDGIEYFACLADPTPQELIERMELFYYLWNALNSLSEIQGRRVEACVILGLTYREQATIESVGKSSVQESVQRGLETMKKYLRNYI